MQWKIEGHKFNQKHKQIAQKTNWLKSLKEKFEKMRENRRDHHRPRTISFWFSVTRENFQNIDIL